MNTKTTPLPWRSLMLALLCLLLLAVPTFASEPLQANFLMDLVGDRARMIQASIVCVVLGCSLLWWKR